MVINGFISGEYKPKGDIFGSDVEIVLCDFQALVIVRKFLCPLKSLIGITVMMITLYSAPGSHY